MKYATLHVGRKDVPVFELRDGSETLDAKKALVDHYARVFDAAGASSYDSLDEVINLLASDSALVEALWLAASAAEES